MSTDDPKCFYCTEEGRSVDLQYDTEALSLVCPECGLVPPSWQTTDFETIARATEDDGHLLGRSLVDQLGRVVGSSGQGRLPAVAAANQARLVRPEAESVFVTEQLACVSSFCRLYEI